MSTTDQLPPYGHDDRPYLLPDSAPTEASLWQLWQLGKNGPLGDVVLAKSLTTEEGDSIEIIYPGRRSGSGGPDFRGAIVCWPGGQVRHGDVELHLRSSDWVTHGHHHDRAYDNVQLHVVLSHDGPVARHCDGSPIPTLVLGRYLAADLAAVPLRHRADHDDSAARTSGCRVSPALDGPAIRRLVEQAGRERLRGKAATMEGDLACLDAEDVLFRALLDAAGYSRNRAPCRALGERLTIGALHALCRSRPVEQRVLVAEATLLGMAGLLPEDQPALADEWQRYTDLWPHRPLAPADWVRAGVRPANRPETRLRGIAALVAIHAQHGLITGLLAPLLTPTLVEANPVDVAQRLIAGLTVTYPVGESTRVASTPIGASRAADMAINVLIPFALAWASCTNDTRLEERAFLASGVIPAGGDNDSLSQMMDRLASAGHRLQRIGALHQQGLLHLWSQSCAMQDCLSCPLADHAIR